MKIEITQGTFQRLQRHAVPFKDTPEDVIVRMIGVYEKKMRRERPDPGLLDKYLPEEMRTKRRVSGFAGELWELVIAKLGAEFSLAEVYRSLEPLRKKRPHVKELEASVRAGLQTLRDAGHIEFLDNRGQYRRL